MSTPKSEITAETITTIINDKRPTSLTDISRALGHKGTISGSVAARIRELVPNVTDLIAANKPAKDATGDASGTKPVAAKGDEKPKVAKSAKSVKKAKVAAKPVAGKKTAGAVAYPIPDCCPYRHTDGCPSGYAMIFSILFSHREKGISKPDLVAKYRAWSGASEETAGFSVHVVTSPKEDGSCHRSSAKAAQTYWVERQNDWLKLRLLSEKK